jgi:NADH-quinone oxidoreductase subunit M
MILTLVIVILLLGGVLAWIAGRWHKDAPRWLALFALVTDFALLWLAWHFSFTSATIQAASASHWLAQESWSWIPRFGIHFHLAMDGLSVWLISLALFLGLAAVLASWREISERTGFFHFNVLWTLAGVLGVFMALDLFLFFVFWEVMLVPMYFLIAIWGHERRIYAALKFFLFTQASGLLMLVAILALVFVHHQNTGAISFDYAILLNTNIAPQTALWIMLGFFIAFAVKLPIVPLHSWLPDAHSEAPTGGSVLLAGVLLKTGAYGMIRFVVPLFPDTALNFAPVAMALGATGIIYGAILAFAQNDLKRLVAYTSVSHMGFIILGIFAWNSLALQGVLLQIIAHGLSTGALFIIAGQLQERIHTREMSQMGGLWGTMPKLGALGLFFAVASLGLPGLANFIGEVVVLMGSFQVSRVLTICAALGLIGAAVYALSLVQKIFFGGNEYQQRSGWTLHDASRRESLVLLGMVAITVWLGLYPHPVFTTAKPAFDALQQKTLPQNHVRTEVARRGVP